MNRVAFPLVTSGSSSKTAAGQRARARRAARPRSVLALPLILVGLGGCAGPEPTALAEVAYESRAITQQRDGLAVSAVPLSDGESQMLFGVPLADFDVQPVWIRIENRSAWARWFFPVSVDPAYYPAYEVAHRVATFTAPSVEQLYLRLSERAIKPFVMPGETVSGFVYAHRDEGFKAFNVDVVGRHEIESFQYAVPIPGLQTDVDALVVEANATAPSLDDEALRRWLTDLPCCASAADGRPGDPLNVVLVGNLDAIRAALVSRHWDVTARLTARSGWQMAKDTTHVIAPDIDDSRYYLVEDLLYGGRVRQIGFVGGVGRASLRSPRRNAEDAPYFTDGLRAVLFLSEDVVPFSRIKLLDWELPAFMKPFAPGDSETRSARTDAAGGD